MSAIADLQARRIKTRVDIAAIDGLQWVLNNYEAQGL